MVGNFVSCGFMIGYRFFVIIGLCKESGGVWEVIFLRFRVGG